MWFAVIDGQIWFETKARSQKAVNLRRDDRITVMVEDGLTYDTLRGVSLEGRATIVEDPEALWAGRRERVGALHRSLHRGGQAARRVHAAQAGRGAGRRRAGALVGPPQAGHGPHPRSGARPPPPRHPEGHDPATPVPAWPALPVADWQDTRDTLHLWTQVVGKVQARPHAAGQPLVERHALRDRPRPHHRGDPRTARRGASRSTSTSSTTGCASAGPTAAAATVALEPPLGRRLPRRGDGAPRRRSDLATPIWAMPVEIPDAVPVRRRPRPRQLRRRRGRASSTGRSWTSTGSSPRSARGFVGKCSPVHFFWGAFDHAVTRFSGRAAPPHPGGAPNCGPHVMREAYSHEVSSAGFWPGGSRRGHVLLVRLPRARRASPAGSGCPRARRTAPSSASSCCPTRRCARRRSRRPAARLPAAHLRGRRRARRLGPRRARASLSRRSPSAHAWRFGARHRPGGRGRGRGRLPAMAAPFSNYQNEIYLTGTTGAPPAVHHRSGRASRRRPARCSTRRRTATWPAAPGPARPPGPTGPPSSAGASCRGCCATSACATSPPPCWAHPCRPPCCWRRSACRRSSTRTASWRRRGRRPHGPGVHPLDRRRPLDRAGGRGVRRRPPLVPAVLARPTATVAASLVGRAEAAGYSALVVTLDTFVMGWRPTDLDTAYLPFLQSVGIANYLTDPAFTEPLGPDAQDVDKVFRWAGIFGDPSLTWGDLAWLRQQTSLPVVLKGILHPDDARAAVEAGRRRHRRVQPRRTSGRRGHRLARRPAGGAGRRRPAPCPCCSTPACAPGPTSSRRWRWGRRRCCTGGRTSTGWASAVSPGSSTSLRCLLGEMDVTMALSGRARLADLGPDVLVAG